MMLIIIFSRNPFPVKLEPSSSMKESIQKALNKTMVQLSANGNCRTIKVSFDFQFLLQSIKYNYSLN